MSSPDARRVAICIVSFRSPNEIAACCAALAELQGAAFDVVVCENGGGEWHRALVAALAGLAPGGHPVDCIDAGANLGYAGGVNACLAARPDARAWWVVNPDARPAPGALAALLARLDRGDVDAVGGVLCRPDGSVQADGGRWHSWLARAESLGMGRRLTGPVDAAAVEARLDYLLGASMLVSPRFLSVAGPMRADYFLYAEEIEWFVRAKALGLRLGFAPDAHVLHAQGTTTGSAAPLHERPRLPIYCDERNRLHVVRDTTPARLPVAVVAALALLLLRYARRGAWRQTGYALAGWRAGVRGERGVPPGLADG